MGKDTNKPLKGARVLTYTDFVQTVWNTDNLGRIRVDLSKLVFDDDFGFDVWANGYVQQRHFFRTYDPQTPRIPDQFTVALLPGEETLGGKVANEDGRPIAGARVVLWGHLGEKKEPHELAFMVDAMTDSNGEWRCRSCRKMTFAYIYLSHPDYVADEQSHPRTHGQPQEGKPRSPDDPALEGLRAFSDVQVMKRGVAIVGQVTDQKGNAVADGEVGRIEAHHLDTFSWDMPTTRTDRQGRFAFPHVRPGKYALQVKARGHAPELKLVTAAEKSEPVSIALAPPRVLSGRFVDTLGKPIAGAYVYMSGWRGSWALGVNLKTDADGRFRWEDAPDDSIRISAGREGYDGVYRLNVVAGEGGLNLTFKRTLTISGRLTDKATGQPIERGSVEVGVPDSNGGPTKWSPQEGVNAFDGRFQASLDAERRSEYRLRLQAKGYEPFETRAFRSAEEGGVRRRLDEVCPTAGRRGVWVRPEDGRQAARGCGRDNHVSVRRHPIPLDPDRERPDPALRRPADRQDRRSRTVHTHTRAGPGRPVLRRRGRPSRFLCRSPALGIRSRLDDLRAAVGPRRGRGAQPQFPGGCRGRRPVFWRPTGQSRRPVGLGIGSHHS